MTAPAGRTVASEDRQSGAKMRRGGRNFMIAFYAALRAIKLYPLEHTAVQKTLAELSQVAEELRAEEGELEFRVSGEFIFLNATRLRLDLSNYATFGHILTLCKLAGIGAIHVGTNGTAREWTLLLSLLGGESKAAPAERYKEILSRLKEAKIETFQLDAPTETASDRELNEETKAAANRTYSQSVAVTKDVINSVRIGKTPNIRKIKRVVQGIVDQVLNEETSLIGLTTIRDYDEYTFTGSDRPPSENRRAHRRRVEVDGRSPMARRAGSLSVPPAAGRALISRHDGLSGAPHEDRSHWLPESDSTAPGESSQQDRVDSRRIRRRNIETRIQDRGDNAIGRARGDA